jgi:hypothetical protein
VMNVQHLAYEINTYEIKTDRQFKETKNKHISE